MDKKQKLIEALKSGKVKDEATLAVFSMMEEMKDELEVVKQQVDNAVKQVKESELNLPKVLETIKGQDGHTPTDEELLSLIQPMIDSLPKPEDGKTPTNKEILALIKPLIPNVKNGENGETPSDEKLMSLIMSVMPPMPDMEKMHREMEKKIKDEVEKDLPQFGEKMRDGLEVLENDEKLSIQAIKGLEETVKKLEEKIISTPHREGFRSSQQTIFHDLSASTDGSTKIFSVPKGLAGVVISSDFPTILMENRGYTINATRTQITLTNDNAPSSGSQLVYICRSIFNV